MTVSEQPMKPSRAASFDTWVSGLEGAVRAGVVGWWRRSGTLFLFLLGVSVACFGIDLFNLSISIDEEIAIFTSKPAMHWIEQDRWGMYLIHVLLLPSPGLPFISLLIGLMANALVGAVLVSLWGGLGSARGYVAGAFIVGTPALGFVMHFNNSQYGFFIGLLAAALAVVCYARGGIVRVVIGWMLLVFAISVYQAIALAALVAYLIWVLSRLSLGSPEWSRPVRAARSLALFGAWFTGGLAGHKLSNSVVRAMSASDGGYAMVDGVYSGNFLQTYQKSQVFGQIRNMLLGDAWYMGWQTGAVVIGSVLVIAGMVCRHRRSWGGRLLGMAVLAAVCVAPFLLVIVTGRQWPTRTMLGLPVLLGGLAFCALGARIATVRVVVFILCLLCLIHFIVANNRLMHADHLGWWRDRDLAMRIQERLAVARGENTRPVRIALLGVPASNPTASVFREDTIGASIFAWDGGNPYRVAMLLRTLGGAGISGTTSQQDYRRAMELGQTMTAWPAPGSVVVEGDLAVIRFGAPTPVQIRRAQ